MLIYSVIQMGVGVVVEPACAVIECVWVVVWAAGAKDCGEWEGHFGDLKSEMMEI